MSETIAIVVPLKDRDQYLEVFLDRVPRYLEEVNGLSRYFIVVSEQRSDGLFSAAVAKDIGASHAIDRLGCSRIVFNDVDMIPVENVDYRSDDPATICFMNFGSCKVAAEAFLDVNGLNPRIFGWGYEDSEFYHRLETFGHDCVRWDRSREYDEAVVMDLELRRKTRDEEIRFSEWYWRRDEGSRGAVFRSPEEAIEHYDKNSDWFSEERKRSNLQLVNSVYNRGPSDRRAYYEANGLSCLDLNAYEASRTGRIIRLKYDVAEVLRGDLPESSTRDSVPSGQPSGQ